MVFVIVVSYNGAPWIRQCLESIRLHAPAAKSIVVDNGSKDDTPHIVAEEYPEVELIHTGWNLGFGGGNNLGIQRALDLGAEFLLLLNQDAFVLPNSVERMSAFMQAHPEYGVCSPLHCGPDENQLDYKTFRGYLVRYASDYLRDTALGRAKTHYDIYGVNAAVWFVRRQAFLKVGGFDPMFFMYGEDDDLLARFRHHGIRFALLTDTRAVHLRQSTPAPDAGFLERVHCTSKRIESTLLAQIKRPGYSMSYMLALLVGRGMLEPLADFLAARDWSALIAALQASLRLLAKLPRVRRHALLTAQEGSHFLGRGIASSTQA